MGIFPEKEPKLNVVEEHDQEASALSIEHKEVLTPIPTNFKAQVYDDNGKPLISTPQSQTVVITIPAVNEEELKADAKGNIEETWTWSAVYWIRRILKALHFSKKYVFKGEEK